MRGLLIAITLLGCSLFSFSQQRAQALLQSDTATIRMGEQIKLKLTLFYNSKDKSTKISWPNLPDSISDGKILIVEKAPIDTLVMGSKDNLSQALFRDLIITGFDSGSFTVGPFAFLVNGDSIFSNSIDISIKTFEVDTTKAIKEIKGIEEVSYTILDWIKDHKIGLIVGAAILVAAFFVIRYLRKRRRNRASDILPAAPPRPAFEIALEKLNLVRTDRLWQKVEPKIYFTEVSEILRSYVEKRFQVFAHEQTSNELIQSLAYSTCSVEEKERLRNILQTADMVKFAKQQPDEQQALQTLDMAIKFVEQTKEVVTETPTPNA